MKDPNPDPEELEYGMTDREQIFAIVTAVLVITIIFEKMKEFFTEAVAHTGMSNIVERLFGELTIMGFIGLIIFLLNRADAINKEMNEKAEQIHMVIFVVALLFLTEVIILIKHAVVICAKWRRHEECILADPLKGRVSLMFEFADAERAYKRSFWSRLNFWKRQRYHDAACMFEFHAIRDAFVEDKKHSNYAERVDWERIKGRVDTTFNFSEYLKHLLHDRIAGMVELSPLTWFLIWSCFVPIWVVLKYMDDFSAVIAFVVSPYLMIMIVMKIVYDLRGVRTALAPTLMHSKIKRMSDVLDGTPTEDDHLDVLLNAQPRRGSVHVGRQLPPRPMASCIGEDEVQPLLPPVIIEVTDHLTVKVPNMVNAVLERFVLHHRDNFAPVHTIPYLVNEEENGETLVENLPWLQRLLFGYWHEHRPDAVVTAHEKLFVGLRKGPTIIQAIVQLVLLWTAVYMSVLVTTLLPQVIWSDDISLHLTWRIVVTVVACAPPFFLYGEVARLIEVYVVVAHSGMMKVPRVVMKVLRSTQTRRSLGVLKLLSAVSHENERDDSEDSARPPVAISINDDDEGEADEVGNLRQRVSRRWSLSASVRRRPSKLGGEKRRRRQAEQTALHAFEVCDEDGSGLVNYQEFRSLLESLGLKKSDAELQAICDALDEDKSGEIDRDEFVKWFVNLQLRSKCDLSTSKNIEGFVNHIFKIIDKDGSDNISTEELLATLRTLGQNDLSYEDVREIVSDVDRDGSGGIDREEFVAYIKEHAEFI